MSIPSRINCMLRQHLNVAFKRATGFREISSLTRWGSHYVWPRAELNRGVIFHKSSIVTSKFLHTEGDKELVRFLEEEIDYEQDHTLEEPHFEGFKLYVQSTKITLNKEYKGERIEVAFDINENTNVDDGIIDDEDTNLEEAMNQPDITSYPQFTVTITKPSGRVLQFNCTCNNIGEDIEGEVPEEEQFDLFRFDTLKVYEEGQSSEEVYEAETENLDGELYSNLMTTLLERGITGQFVNDLIEYSTAVEHKKYLQFLKDLKSFAAEK